MSAGPQAVRDLGDHGPLGDLLAPAASPGSWRGGNAAVTAVHVSPVPAAEGRRRTADLPVTWLEADLAALPLDDGSADAA